VSWETLRQTCVLHPVGSEGHVVHFDVSGPPNVITLFFMFRWAWYGFNKKHARARYVELMILHPVGSAGHIAHSGAFEA
jgi:hypothetical protein